MKFRHQFEEKYKGSASDIKFGKSRTVPDLSLTINEMLEQHTRGQGLSVAIKEGHYFETVIPRLEDITDLNERRIELRKIARELDDELRRQKKEKEQENQLTIDDAIKEAEEEKTDKPDTENK